MGNYFNNNHKDFNNKKNADKYAEVVNKNNNISDNNDLQGKQHGKERKLTFIRDWLGKNTWKYFY